MVDEPLFITTTKYQTNWEGEDAFCSQFQRVQPTSADTAASGTVRHGRHGVMVEGHGEEELLNSW